MSGITEKDIHGLSIATLARLALRVAVGVCSRIRNDFNCHVGLRAGTVDDWDRVCHNFCTVELDTQKGDTREPSHSKGAREP